MQPLVLIYQIFNNRLVPVTGHRWAQQFVALKGLLNNLKCVAFVIRCVEKLAFNKLRMNFMAIKYISRTDRLTSLPDRSKLLTANKILTTHYA